MINWLPSRLSFMLVMPEIRNLETLFGPVRLISSIHSYHRISQRSTYIMDLTVPKMVNLGAHMAQYG